MTLAIDPVIDLRSDTVTKPDAAMRRAMAEAEVGDDVFGEDPTVRALEAEGAAAVGCEAALFVPTGTMGNQVALAVHARPGSEVVCEDRAHVYDFEMGAMAALSGLMPRLLRSADGLPAAEAFERAVAEEASFHARCGAFVVENTHNMAGGRAFGRARLEPILAVARRLRLPVHLDGARIFNAALAVGTAVPDLCRGFDSVMFCLSKGLGAPVGSLLCGSAGFVAEGRRVRKRFGGGMRQAGVLAAAGLVALRQGPSRLAEDHVHARRLAEALASLPGVAVDLDAVETNIVIIRVTDPKGGDRGAPAFTAAARRAGVLAVALDAERVRFVTHRDVGRQAIDAVAPRLARALAAPA